MKDWTNRICCVVFMLLFTCAAIYVAHDLGQRRIEYVEVPMGVSDTQRFLQAEGLYHGKIDNVWREQTERAWCDYMAVNVWPKGD